MDIQTLANQFLNVIQAQSNTTDATKAGIGQALNDFLVFVQSQGFTITVAATTP